MEQMVKSRPRDDRLDAFGQLHGVDVHRVMDVQAGEVDDDLFGDALGRAHQLDLVAHDVQHAALLEAGGVALVAELHRNGEPHLGAFAEPHEIDMHRAVGHRIDLHLTRDHARLGAGDVEHDERGREAAGLEGALQRAVVDRDVLGRRVAAIDHRGHEALLAGLEGRSLAGAAARLGDEFLGLAHDLEFLGLFRLVIWEEPAKARLLADAGALCNGGFFSLAPSSPALCGRSNFLGREKWIARTSRAMTTWYIAADPI
ncbi:MAG: hypothetical protein WDM86_12885 [Rhizomicrobium sp.]